MARTGSAPHESHRFKGLSFLLTHDKENISAKSCFPYPLLFISFDSRSLAINSKGEAHLILNQCRFEFCDYFFFLATYLGDGIAVVSIVILLCFVKYRYAIFTGLSNIISSLITQTLKHTLFADQVRPAKYFEGIVQLNRVPWVENYFYNSFPSGHTTAAFTTFFCLALMLENRSMKFLMFVVALTIGFSRVYLSQHFLNDVYAGSIIGVIISFFMYQLFFVSGRTKDIGWMERSILKNK